MNPGMSLQIYRNDATIMHGFISHFMPKLTDTIGLRPTDQDFFIKDPIWNGWFGVKDFDTKIYWSNIKYTDTDIELDKVKFTIDDYEGHGLFVLDFPAYKNLIIEAHQEVVHWLWGSDSEVTVSIKDFDMDFKGQFKLD